MSIETECQTPGAHFETRISDDSVSVKVTLPFPLDLPESQAKVLSANLHNAVELALAQYFVPKYNHDCDSCIFLGSFTYDAPLSEDSVEKTCDLWHCPRCDEGTLIARFSGDGPNYASAPISLVKRDYVPRAERGERQSTAGPAIVEAYRRWEKS